MATNEEKPESGPRLPDWLDIADNNKGAYFDISDPRPLSYDSVRCRRTSSAVRQVASTEWWSFGPCPISPVICRYP